MINEVAYKSSTEMLSILKIKKMSKIKTPWISVYFNAPYSI